MTSPLSQPHPGTFYANFPEPLAILDGAWKVTYINPAGGELFAKASGRLQGDRLWDQWPAESRAVVEQCHRRALQEMIPVQLAEPRSSGSQRWFEVRVFHCDLGIAACYHDVTEQRRISELQSRLSAVVKSADDAIISKSLDGIITSWNRGAEKLFGYTGEEIIGKHVSTLAAPEVVDEIPNILARLKRGEVVDHYQTKRKTKDGRILTVSLTVSPIRDASGNIIGASKVARDITGGQELWELQRRLAAIVESSDDAIISKDLDGNITSWNRGAENLFGYTAAEIVGKHISTIAAPDVIDEIPRILAKLRAGEKVDHYQTRRRTKDGRILTVSLTVSPIYDASGKVIGASKVARDVTDRERYEADLRAANDSLLRSNADLQQFAYSASHDLQEPLRMVSAYCELLKLKFGGKLGPQGEEYLGYAVEGALRMEQLLQDLKAYVKASTEDSGMVEPVEADRALDKALLNLEVTIRESGAVIERMPLPQVRIRDFQLTQVFQNLIGNSLRYRRAETPRIQVGAIREGTDWVFSVQDNGIGIESQYKEQVFGIFKRLHSASEYPGTGMGLAICQRIIQRAGGRIWLESEPGEGTTLFFALPA